MTFKTFATQKALEEYLNTIDRKVYVSSKAALSYIEPSHTAVHVERDKDNYYNVIIRKNKTDVA